MSELLLPKPIGELSPGDFIPFIELGTTDIKLREPLRDMRTRETASKIAHLVCNHTNVTDFDGLIVRQAELQPGKAMGSNIAQQWHTDGTGIDLIICDVVPTEYITGSHKNIRKLLGLHWWQHSRSDTRNSVYARQVAHAMNSHDDKTLAQMGFEIWTPEPYQVLSKNALHIHRAPKNLKVAPVKRTLVVMYSNSFLPQDCCQDA